MNHHKDMKDKKAEIMKNIYTVYLMSKTGQYHYGYEFDDEKEAIDVAARYQQAVPEIRVTDQTDRLYLQVKDGMLAESEALNDVERGVFAKATQAELPVEGPDGLRETLIRYQDAVALQNLDVGDAEVTFRDEPGIRNEVMATELDTLALGARDDLDLYEHGFEPSGIAQEVSQQVELNQSQELGLDMKTIGY